MTGSTGYKGALDPFNAQSEYGELTFVMRRLLNQMATATLVKVVAVHDGGPGGASTVDVQPMVHQVDGLNQIMPHGTIYNVPCFRMAAGPFAVIMDPKKDDIGLAVFASRDLSTVKSTKKPAAPASGRKYDWADALYFGGFLTGAATRYIQFTDSGLNIVSPDVVTVTAPTVNVNASTKAVITSPEVDLGGSGGMGVARIGDAVSGGVITGGSTKVKAV